MTLLYPIVLETEDNVAAVSACVGAGRRAAQRNEGAALSGERCDLKLTLRPSRSCDYGA